LWHPSGMLFSHKPISGGVARQASLNHRLSSGKPPACPGGIALPKSCQSRNISYEYISNSKRIITRYGIVGWQHIQTTAKPLPQVLQGLTLCQAADYLCASCTFAA
ncbi:MAG: hypothetical protein LBM04_05380, partial [Opitutaceae bacterium]|nr:hypothetical protein [Opitutaceae bacterium]